ncbi:TPA: hypothetical protein ACNZYS_001665 [Streptococcus pyogenes]
MLTYDEFKQAIDRGDSGRSDGGIRQIKKTFPSPKSDAPQRKITTLFTTLF